MGVFDGFDCGGEETAVHFNFFDFFVEGVSMLLSCETFFFFFLDREHP